MLYFFITSEIKKILNAFALEVFPDPIIANATVDRIFDRAKTVLFKGQSYRLKGKIKKKELKAIDGGLKKH